MKTVFSNQGVCHAWASQQQASGKSDHIFFEGPSIYSYGRHFEAARFITPDVVFITTRTYSVTTASHLSLIQSAVHHKQVFTVPSFTDHAENLAYYFSEARAFMVKAGRARKSAEAMLSTAQDMLALAMLYLDTFPTAVDTASPELKADIQLATEGRFFAPEIIAQIQQAAKTQRQAELTRQKEARAKKEAEQAEALEQWKQGATIFRYFESTALRVKDGEVQTTKGATVPVIEARKLYRALKAGVNVIGQRVGLYTVNALTAENLVIGCHTIPLSEVERIAPEVMG